MRSALPTVSALLFGIALLLLGTGLQVTLLGVRGAIEGFSPTAIGLLMAAYYVGFGASCFVTPKAIERVGHIRVFAALASVASAASLLHAVYVDPWVWAVLRVITGYCMAGLYMVAESWLNGRVPNRNRGTLLAIYMIVNIGAMAVSQQFMNLADPTDFLLFALSSVLVSLALVPVAMTRSVAPAPVPTDRMPMTELYTVSPLGTIGAFLIGVANGAMWGLLPLVGIGLELSVSRIATLMSVILLGGLVLQWPVGWISDRFDRRLAIIGTAVALALSCGGLYFLVGGDRLPTLVTAFLFGGASFAVYPLCAAYINDWITDEDLVQASAALLLVFGAGAAVGPIAGSFVVEHLGGRHLFTFMGAVALVLVVFGAYRTSKRAAVPMEDQGTFAPVMPTTPSVMDVPYESELDPADIVPSS